MAVYVQAALICERIIVEPDRAVSAIRIIDRITVALEPSVDTPAAGTFSLFVSLRFGEGPRPSRVAIDVENPAGERTPLVDAPAGLPGENGANIYGQLQLVFTARGSYWFHVLADGVELTRILFLVQVGGPRLPATEGTQP
jgi:hypothetical protein